MLLKILIGAGVLAAAGLTAAGLHHQGDCCPGARLLSLLHASAADPQTGKDAPTLSGTWVQKGGEMKIDFQGKDTMKLSPHGDNMVIVVICKYTVGKDGQVKAKITELEGKEDAKKQAKEILPVGLEFHFSWQAKGDAATIENVDGKDLSPLLKSHLEGKYEKK